MREVRANILVLNYVDHLVPVFISFALTLVADRAYVNEEMYVYMYVLTYATRISEDQHDK